MYTYLCFFKFLCTFIYLFLITAGLALKTHLPFEHKTLQQGRSGGVGFGFWGSSPECFFKSHEYFGFVNSFVKIRVSSSRIRIVVIISHVVQTCMSFFLLLN